MSHLAPAHFNEVTAKLLAFQGLRIQLVKLLDFAGF